MPELPDVVVYIEALERRLHREKLESVRLASPFLLRSVDPPIQDVCGRRVVGLRRLGKRIVIELEGSVFLVLHLMIAGRLRWEERGKAVPGRIGLAAFDFSSGTLVLTEAGSKKRASLYAVQGEEELARHDPGGVEPFECGAEEFGAALRRESHTLKRSLTSPRLFSGIGNAYSDEILHRARLSPLKLTGRLDDAEIARLHAATVEVLGEWVERLRAECADGFPKKVTAFREGMAVHGRYREPCPVCGSPVQRIVYSSNETNYCATCQTEGRLLADRALSRLLKDDWPKRLEDWER